MCRPHLCALKIKHGRAAVIHNLGENKKKPDLLADVVKSVGAAAASTAAADVCECRAESSKSRFAQPESLAGKNQKEMVMKSN